MMKLSGKKALITGANRSIGQSIALAYAKEGADIVISYRSDQTGAQETVRAIESLGRKAKAIQADFSHLNEVENYFSEALDFLGTVDLLVNNAAGYDTTDFLNLDIKVFDDLLKVGATAPLFLTQLVAKQMIQEKKGGSVLNISSISGLRPYPN